MNQSDGNLETVVGEAEIVKNIILVPLIYIEGVGKNISIADFVRHAEGVFGGGETYGSTSLLHEIAHQAAYVFSRTLYRTNRGVDAIDFSPEAIVRNAASAIMSQVSQGVASIDLYWSGDELHGRFSMDWNLFNHISEAARQRYEGGESRGAIVVTQPSLRGIQKWNVGAAAVDAGPISRTGGSFQSKQYEQSDDYVGLEGEGGIAHSQRDALRKLLETAQEPLALLSDGTKVYGLKSFPDEQGTGRRIPDRFLNIVFHGGPNW